MLEEKSLIFRCPATLDNDEKCDECWDYKLVRTVSCLSDTEKRWVERTMSENVQFCSPKSQHCPNCQIYCVNENSRKRGRCVKCDHEFCWSCRLKWNNIGNNVQCGNDRCTGEDPRVIHLKENTKKKQMGYTGVEAYDTRACPRCGFVIHHTGGCKQVVCPGCKVNFCFVCLSIYDKETQTWPCGTYNVACEVAPIQTEIPTKE